MRFLKPVRVLGQQRDVIGRLLAPAAGRFLDEAAAGRDVGLDAQHRIDAQFLRLLIELQRAVQIAVIGERERVHLQVFRPLQERGDLARPVQKAVMAVAMQMRKRRHAHGSLRSRVFPSNCILTRRGRFGRASGYAIFNKITTRSHAPAWERNSPTLRRRRSANQR